MGERDDGQIKPHKRTVVLDRVPRTVLSPRPSEGYRWATNHHHDEWHVLSDHEGGRFLGRMLWVMADQRPGTLLVIDPSCLVANPFDADASMPIVIVNRELGSFRGPVLADLARALPFRSSSEGTVKVRTSGLDERLAAWRAWYECRAPYPDDGGPSPDMRGRIDSSHGLLLMAGAPEVLRDWAFSCLRLDEDRDDRPEDHAELDYGKDRDSSGRGEVQTFLQFARYGEQARMIRDELFPAARNRTLTDEERRAVWERLPA